VPEPDVSSSSSPLQLGWLREAPPEARRALIAAALGWMLDSFDVMLYALVLAALMGDLGIDKTTAGQLGSLTLAASAIGGILFGVIADRYGRTRALIASVIVYSVFTAACGLAQNVLQLAIFRVCLGIGMGGEWASGAALVSETWPAQHRGKALGLMQSAWAIGYGLAAIVNMLVLPVWGWRAVFFVGVAPALFTIWVRRRVSEPALWQARQAERRAASAGQGPGASSGFSGSGLGELFSPRFLRFTVALTLMNACTLFAWWGFNLWIPAFLSLPVAEGGVGLSARAMSMLVVVMQVGMWFGYVTFGFISDVIGRKRSYVIYLLSAAVLMFAYATARDPIVLLVLGPFVAFFGTGYYTGFGAVTAEIYPTRFRATAQGFCYNMGRIASAAAPIIVGSLAQTRGFGAAFAVAATAFLVAATLWTVIPETRGRVLE
jgi:MFS family permease